MAKAKPAPAKAPKPRRTPALAQPSSKQDQMLGLLRRPNGATIAELVKAIGWQPHSIRGAISGSLKKRLGLSITSETVEKRGRVYRAATAS